MNKAVILAIIDAAIKQHLSETNEDKDFLRGPRGFRGRDGRDFNFEDHEIEILNIIKQTVDDNHEKFKLKFSDLSEDEKNHLKLNFEELTEEQKLEITGCDGKDGEDGKSFTFDDLTYEQKQQLRGPRGQRGRTGVGQDGKDGRDGKDFDFEEHKETIYGALYGFFNGEKDNLKLTFEDLTEEERLSLKGEQGKKGGRGQRGKTGDSAYEIWLESNDGTKEEFLDSLKGQDGKSIRGPIGPAGKDGISVVGEKGEDGKDAAEITDVEVDQIDRERFRFIFYLSDGRSIETDSVKIPSISAIYQSVASGGGGGGTLSILSEGTSVGSATSLNFINADDVSIDGTDPNQINVTLSTSATSQLIVQDEGVEISANTTLMNFVGDNVEVTSTSVIADWPSLDVVDNMATYGGSGVTVTVTGGAERLSKTFTAGEAITQNDFIRLSSASEVFKATNNSTYEEAQVVGIALADAAITEQVEVLLFGILEDPSFSFTINNPFFLGVNGAAIQNPPTSTGEFVVEIGQSLGVGAIFLDISRPQEIV